jgi:hypothetical protein
MTIGFSPDPTWRTPQSGTEPDGDYDQTTWPDATVPSIVDAIFRTVLYADLFDYPLTAAQIHRYLTGYSAPLEKVEEQLEKNTQLRGRLGSVPPYWVLVGREHLAALRRQRETYSQPLWSAVWRYEPIIAGLPFVRMTAVTGALAMDNADSADDDIDLFIVARGGRVWLARGLVILVVHLARQLGTELCPNYVMAEHNLRLEHPNLFTAHELAQLVPIHGAATYHRLLEMNAWLGQYLPNAKPRTMDARKARKIARTGQHILEAPLNGRLGDSIESWEQRRKILRLRQAAAQIGASGARYTPDLCKGHVDSHETSVEQRYTAQLTTLGT